MTIEIHTMGDYWHADRRERTPLGELVHRAKDLGSESAAAELATRFAHHLAGMALGESVLLATMPPSPDRPAPLLERLVADLEPSLGSVVRDLMVRRQATPRVRDLDPAERPAAVRSAGYAVVGDCIDAHVVVIDDVVLTGTTLRHVAGLVLDAGAAAVTPLAVARTRR